MVAETVETLKANATEKTGLRDFGDTWFEQPLAAWVEDLSGPRLTDQGRSFLGRLAVTNLCRRLEVVDWYNRHPEIHAVAIPPILYVTGLERSGTTFLHNLLALHPNSRALLRWEMMRPAPPPEASTYRTDPRIAEVQASADRLRGTLLERMHWVNADEPEECTWAALDCTGLLGRSVFPLMPTWHRWLIENDLTPSFLEYRRLIKLLTWRNPVPPSGHLVLKSPQNLGNIAQLSNVFPEARFVITHRDPFRACTSACTMIDHINAPFAAQKDSWRPGGTTATTIIQRLELALSRLMAFVEAASAKMVHVPYPALVKDPATGVREIYDRFGIDTPQGLRTGIAEFVAAQSAGKRAMPLSDLPSHGLDHGAFLARSLIAPYCKQFGVEPEVTRLTGA